MGDERRRQQREKHILQAMETCVHFCGIQHKTCEAGVSMERREGFRIPCMPAFPTLKALPEWPCDKKRLPTREEAEAEEAKREEQIQRFLAKLNRGICGTCGVEGTDWKQAGSCIYSEPCGHRVGQGDAAEYKAAVLEARRTPAAPETGGTPK